MSCKECSKLQDLAFDKNVPNTTPIAYVRIENANVALVGCRKHLKILIERLNKQKDYGGIKNEK